MLDHFFLLLVPKDSESLKNIGHPTLGIGGKKTVKRYLKSEQTNTQTDGRTNTQPGGHFDLQKASAQRADALKILRYTKLKMFYSEKTYCLIIPAIFCEKKS